MMLRLGWGNASLDDGLAAMALMVDEGMAVCGDTGDSGKRWLCCSNHSSCDGGSGDKELALRRTDPVGRFN